MKNNKFILRVIIGLTTFALLAMVYWIFRLNYDKDMKNNNAEQKGNNSIYEINRLIPGGENKQLNSSEVVSSEQVLSMQDINWGDSSKNDKQEILELINKGMQLNPNVEAFMYSDILFNDNVYTDYYLEKEYNDVLEIVQFQKYKSDDYRFSKKRDTNDYIWGVFRSKKDNNDFVHVVVNKTNGIIESYINKSIQLIIH